MKFIWTAVDKNYITADKFMYLIETFFAFNLVSSSLSFSFFNEEEAFRIIKTWNIARQSSFKMFPREIKIHIFKLIYFYSSFSILKNEFYNGWFGARVPSVENESQGSFLWDECA
jgi:hypothetical protein